MGGFCMYMLFGDIFTEAKAAYIKAKLTVTSVGFLGRENSMSTAEIDEMTAKIVGETGKKNLPVFQYTSMKDHASDGQIARIKMRMRCASETLVKASPFLEGETLRDDFFSYLTEAYGDIPAGSAVLKRTTNMAELYYIFEQVEVSDGNVNFRKAIVQHKDFEIFPANSLLVSIFTWIGEKLLGKLADEIGAKIIASAFGEGVPSYFEEVYQEITKIVHQEITQNTIDTIDGKINGVQQWIKSVYIPRKSQPGITKQELFDMLSPYIDDIFYSVGILQQPSFSKPGLAVFMLVGGVHLALLQEQALVDPHAATPSQSSYATSVKIQAQLYSKYAIDTYNTIINDRTDSNVIYVRQVRQGHYAPGTGGYYIYGHSWYDAYIDKFGTFFTDGDKTDDGNTSATNEMQGHTAAVISQLSSDLGSPVSVSQNWQQLVTTPVPSTT